jgi:hypothetical protein
MDNLRLTTITPYRDFQKKRLLIFKELVNAFGIIKYLRIAISIRLLKKSELNMLSLRKTKAFISDHIRLYGIGILRGKKTFG